MLKICLLFLNVLISNLVAYIKIRSLLLFLTLSAIFLALDQAFGWRDANARNLRNGVTLDYRGNALEELQAFLAILPIMNDFIASPRLKNYFSEKLTQCLAVWGISS